MTFTEAAIEVLRRAGKPLHVKDIAGEAVNAGILSHVGQTPEETMGSRLLAMARRDQDRRVVAMEPGFFALAEWGLPPPAPPVEATPAAEAVAADAAPAVPAEPVAEAAPAQAELPYRDRERHPPLQKEIVVGSRRDERRRPRETDGDGRRHKRYPLPAETAWQWLRDKGEPAALADIAKSLRESDRIAEALERDLGSFEKALHEENKRRKDGRRPLLFEFTTDGLVRALEPQAQPRPERQAQRPRREEPVRPIAADEQRRNVRLRSIRRRIGSLDGAALERVSVALIESQGYNGLNMVRRSQKDGPLYLARHKFGAGELRYAIRVLRPDRMISREDVQGVRHDLAKYSAQMGVIIGSGECGREAKSEANISNDSPVLLYGGEALAEALLDAGFGATKRLIEWLEYDDDFFTSVGAGDALPDVEGAAPEPEPVEADGEATPAAPEQADRPRERDRHRGRRPRRGPREGQRETPRPAEASADGVTAAPVDQAAHVGETPAAPPAEASPVEAAPAPAEAAHPPSEAPAPAPEPPPPPLDA